MTQPKRQWHELPLPTQAAIRCGEPKFQAFLAERYDDPKHAPTMNSDRAADIVRYSCAVTSRRDLARIPAAAERWNFLDREYLRWLTDQPASPPPIDDTPPHDHDPMDEF